MTRSFPCFSKGRSLFTILAFPILKDVSALQNNDANIKNIIILFDMEWFSSTLG